MVELGLLGDHKGDEEPALRCRAPSEGRREPGGTSGGVGDPRGPQEGPPVSDPGRWPDREPTLPAVLEGGAVLCITDADANNWLFRAMRNALTHWRYRRQNPPPSKPQPPHKQRRR